jgi:hypothetical protein
LPLVLAAAATAVVDRVVDSSSVAPNSSKPIVARLVAVIGAIVPVATVVVLPVRALVISVLLV